MARLGVKGDALARILRSHGEDGLAERVASITDDVLMRIVGMVSGAGRERARQRL